MTQKEFWVQAYLALLQRYDPEQAIAEADKALAVADERWKDPVMEGIARPVGDKPFGEVDYRRQAKVRL